VASLFRHPQSKYWTACFRNTAGKQRRISTKTTDKRLAQRIADQFEKASRNKVTLAQIEKTLRTFAEELDPQIIERRSLRAFCSEWLAEKEPSVSTSTFKFYRQALQRYLAHLGERSDRPIGEITRNDLVTYRNQLAARVSAVTANHDVAAVKAVFAAAKALNRIYENPAESLKPVRETQKDSNKRRPFTIGELQALIAAADPEWQSMIRFGLYCGARLIDVALLQWLNIDLIRGELRYEVRKTGKRICVPLVGSLLAHIESLDASDDPRAFLHPRAAASVQRRRSSSGISTQFGQLLELAGLRPPKDRSTKAATGSRRSFAPLSFHSLRHTAVSLLKDAGVPQATVQELVGHSSAEMSALYTHVGFAALAKAAASLPAL
jgi:integrase